MNKVFITILLSLLFISSVFAQSHLITYKFSVEGCGDIPELEIFRGIMFEGDNISFEPYTFPQGNSESQFFYNLMVGGELGFPVNCLNENINVNIVLKGICDLDLTSLTSEEDILKILYLSIEVTGQNTGVHSDESYYYLANNKEAYFRLPSSKITQFLAFFGYSINDFTPFYYTNNNEIDLNGINKTVDNNFISIYLQHFSTLGFGLNIETTDSNGGGDSDSTDTTTDINSIEITPNSYSLNQNYPNPFNPSTTISYTLKNAGLTKISIYNSLGEIVESLVNEIQFAGSHNVNFSAVNLPSGMYFYTLSSGNFTQTNKMILMK